MLGEERRWEREIVFGLSFCSWPAELAWLMGSEGCGRCLVVVFTSHSFMYIVKLQSTLVTISLSHRSPLTFVVD